MAMTVRVNGKHCESGQVGGDAVCEPLHLHYNELSRNPVCTLTKNIPAECGPGANDQG